MNELQKALTCLELDVLKRTLPLLLKQNISERELAVLKEIIERLY